MRAAVYLALLSMAASGTVMADSAAPANSDSPLLQSAPSYEFELVPIREFNGLRAPISGEAGSSGIGAFVALPFGDDDTTDLFRAGVQVVPDNQGATDALRVTIGGAYSHPLGDAWRVSLGASSTYVGDGLAPVGTVTPRTFAFESQSAAGLRDVGVNLGLSYDWTKTWAVASEIGYARSLGEGPAGGQTPATGEFFGTIVLNYRF